MEGTALVRKRLLGVGVLLAALASLPAEPAVAGGPVHGAKAAGMGTAFVAVADDPSAILHNPAGLPQLQGTQMYGGVTAVYVETRFENGGGERDETEFQVFYPPHLYAATHLGLRDWVFALGLHSPFGIGGRKWDRSGLTRYGATESGVATFAANPTLAWRVSPSLSIAVGVDYMRAMNRSERMVDQSLVGAADARFELEGDGDGWGTNLGILFRPTASLRLGLAYRSRIEVDIEGDATFTDIAPALQSAFGGSRFETGADTTLRFPEIYSAGIAYDPNPAWTLALDVEWVRWSSFDRTEVDFEQEVPAAGVVDGTTTLDWRDSWQIKVGAEWRFTPSWAARVGYAYIPTPVPEKSLEPGNPDSDSHNLSVGLGYRGERWVLDAFYNAGLYEDREVDNDILDGEYENRAHFAGLSLGYTF